METRSIPSDQWPEFLDQFSRLHQGKPVTVQTLGREVGAQANVHALPLLGVTAQPGGDGGGEGSIDIMAGDASGRHVRHAVPRATGVWISEWNDGYSAALKIETADGLATVLQVGSPEELLPPGVITDGIILDEQRH